MRNLEKWRKKEIGYAILCIVLLVMPIIIMTLFNVLLSNVLDQNGMTVVSFVSMIVFWVMAITVVKKHFNNMVIVDAMSKNEKRLRTDRRFYPSNRQNVSEQELYSDLSASGFTLNEDEPKLAQKGTTGLWIVENCADYKEFLTRKKSETDKIYSGKKRLSYAACFLCESVGEDEIELSRDVVALNAGCIVPVFYDMSEKKAYFMGGDAGRGSDEAPVQRAIRDIILKHPEPFAEKTNADKTDEENKFDELDLDEIFNQVDKSLASDRDHVEKMSDGEIKLDFDGDNGTIFYKKDGKGISHPFRVNSEDNKNLKIETLEIAYYCFPKAVALKGKKLLEFKEILEKYLTENGYTFTYAGEEK